MAGPSQGPPASPTALPAGAAADEAPATVLLVTLDTTRADRLGAYAPERRLTPRMDALAATGLVFEQARSTNPITLPAHTSMLSGLYPTAHGVRDNGLFRASDDMRLLPEVLAEHGFRTGAALGALVLDARYGLSQGFERYATPPVRRLGQPLRGAARPGNEVVDDALAWLATVGADEPLFLWVHLFDAHFPCQPPEPQRSAHADPYDGEVAFCDAQVGRLLDALSGRNRRLVLVVGDHGEGLGEHGEAVHGVFVYDATMHVPLLVAGQGVPAGRVRAPVSVADVAPTVLDWLGLPANELPDSRLPSLLETAAAEAAGARAVDERPLPLDSLLAYHEHGWHPVRGLLWRGWKYVDSARPELYDLQRDPGELDDLSDRELARVAIMRRRLLDLDAEHPPLLLGRRLTPDSAARAELFGLGYLAPSGDVLPTTAELPDAKDRLPDLRRRDEALWLLWHGRRLMGIDGVLAAVPQAPQQGQAAARHARGREELEQARTLLARLAEGSPGDCELALYLGVVELALGDAGAAAARFERVVEQRPAAADAQFDLAAAREHLGDLDGALRAMRRALELEPRALRATLWIARWHLAHDEPQVAAYWLERLLGPEPVAPDESDTEVLEVAALLSQARRAAAARGLAIAPPDDLR